MRIRNAFRAWTRWAGLLICGPASLAVAQTSGTARLNVRLHDYPGDPSAEHWTVVWVTNATTGAFLKTLWRQGPAITQSHWNKHCQVWYGAKGANNSFDGYSSATAFSYSGVNSPVTLTWNGQDASGQVVPDGSYKFWIQYAEDDGQGPYTTNGLEWVKGPAGATTNYPDQSPYFSEISVLWTPVSVPPVITSAAPTGPATVGVPYQHTCTATGTPTPVFSATGLPEGLALGASGELAGTPQKAGVYTGEITADNGSPPAARQAFTITVTQVPLALTGVRVQGTTLQLQGSGPAHGVFTLLRTLQPALPLEQWTVSGNGICDAQGVFSANATLTSQEAAEFFRVRVP